MDLSDLQQHLADIMEDPSFQAITGYRCRLHRNCSRETCQKSCHIDLLPPELLIQIFDWSIDPREWNMRRIRSLARVCRRWKAVITSTPSLWAVINGNAPLRDMEIATRKSKGVPLALTYKCSHSMSWAEFVQVLRTNQAPWWMVDLEGPGGFFILEQPVFDRPNPSLSHIRLHSTSAFGQALPWLTLSEGCPIRSLDLRFISISWDSPRLTGLVQLRLTHTGSLVEARLAIILMESPLLEELFINGVLVVASPEWCPTNGIRLDRLRFIHLALMQSSFNRILTLLHLSPTTSINIEHMDISDLAKGDDPVLFHIFPPALPASPCIRVKITSYRFSIAVKPSSRNKTRHDVYGLHVGMRLFHPMLIGCWAMFVTKLEMDLPTGFEDVPDGGLAGGGLARLCNLECLTISGESWVTDILSFLSRPQESEPDGGRWPCPKLTSLDLAFRDAQDISIGISFLPSHADAILDLVEQRWRNVSNIGNGTSSNLARLSSLVIRVPEELTDPKAVDALATLACQSAKVLGSGVIRIVSIEEW